MINIEMGLMSFQVTRRCNQICKHCCKGDMQKVNMSKEIIDRLFTNKSYKITEMTHLVITGGEPTLVPDIVEYLINTIIDKNIAITKNVNIFTNGLIYNETIINSINKLIGYLNSNSKCKNTAINFKISNDQFHQNISKKVLEKYKQVEFISGDWLKPFVLTENEIQNDGNAKTNKLNGKLNTDNVPEVNYIIKTKDSIKIKNGICISANGNICNEKNGCATYESEDKFSYGNILKKSLLEIIEKFEEL